MILKIVKKSALSTAICSAVALSSIQAKAAGFQLAEYSATGLGRAFAGEAIIADNASSQGRNPALLAALKGRNISTGAIYVKTNIDVPSDVSLTVATADGKTVPLGRFNASAKDVADNAIVPNFYYSEQLNSQWSWGIGVNSKYGLATEVDSDHASALFGQKTSIKSVEFNPNVAYQVNDTFALGAGVRVVYAEGELNSSVPKWVSSLTLPKPLPLPPAGTSLKALEGDDIAFGWNLGLTWAASSEHQFGLAYHSQVDLTLKGKADGYLYNRGTGKRFDGQLPIDLPAFAEFSSIHQLSEHLKVHTSINWTQWSVFKELRASFYGAEKPLDRTGKPISSELLKEENFKDNWRFAIGTSYELSPMWQLKAGVALDKTAVHDEYRTTTIPDSDRLWYSIGAGYKANEQLCLDIGVTYIKAHGRAPINESIPLTTSLGQVSINLDGEATGDVWLAGIQLSYKL
ncbi:outer membrane protein transport protein [Parashewanella tropica]|uniref:outer membrane protein transport protein n=1 Tax=Parashewanella tropica TaxID=2547970 RepID=UPI00105A076A|nr:outer membrane protein transport protein [Parashewanella tropica]